jgi:hypothetical protein
MKIAFDYLPIAGWQTFSKSVALTEALWQHLDPSNWHYQNFTSDTSIWESKEDGSVLYVAYLHSAIVDVYAEEGDAEQTFDPIALEFGLYKSDPSIPKRR